MKKKNNRYIDYVETKHNKEDIVSSILVRQLSFISADEITIDLIMDISKEIVRRLD